MCDLSSVEGESKARRGWSVQLENLSSGLFEAHVHTFPPHFLAFSVCSQFLKTSEKLSPISPYFYELLSILAIFSTKTPINSDDSEVTHCRRRLGLVGRSIAWGFVALRSSIFERLRILFIRMCLQTLSVNIFSLLIFNPPSLSSLHLFQPQSATCFLIH